MNSGKRISKAWIITPLAVLLLFVFWMFQGIIFKGNSPEHVEKESYDNFFTDYYNNDEGITFDVLSVTDYKDLPLSQDEVLAIAADYLAEKQADTEKFSMIVDQGIYSNMGLGVTDILTWRVLFVENQEEGAGENIESAQDESNGAETNEDLSPATVGENDSAVGALDEATVEERLRYWIVLDGQTGNILSAYSNGK